MSILIDQNSRIIIQGINGKAGSFFAKRMHDYGNNVVGGIAPSHGGEWTLNGKIPLFDTVHECVQSTDADTTVIFVPAYSATDACFEALDSGIKNIICISADVPMKDIAFIKSSLQNKDAILIGPNALGVFTPGKALAGVFPVDFAIEGNLGVISRAGSLCYDVLMELYKNDIGISSVIGLGEDCLSGTSFVDCLDLFEMDAHTDSILIIGQPGYIQESLAATHILESITKPVYAYVAGVGINTNKIIGHTEICMFDSQHNAPRKIEDLSNAGVRIARNLIDISQLINGR